LLMAALIGPNLRLPMRSNTKHHPRLRASIPTSSLHREKTYTFEDKLFVMQTSIKSKT